MSLKPTYQLSILNLIIVLIFTFLLILTLFTSISSKLYSKESNLNHKNFLNHIIDLEKHDLRFYYQKENGEIIRNFKRLKSYLDSLGKKLVFAVNGGMYDKGFTPHGLYIENGKVIKELDTIQEAYGNFYNQPNGVFFITWDNNAYVETSDKIKEFSLIKYATQSGPMLVINGSIHQNLEASSKSINKRNGVGILPSGKIIFVMTKKRMNLYDFAKYFKDIGCKNALYLDGFVSKTYKPEKGFNHLIENFAILIAQIKDKNVKSNKKN